MLPGIDDGASSVEEALLLARIAVNDGITHTVMTPHVHPGKHENKASNIKQVCDKFERALNKADVPLIVKPAGEVRLSVEILPMFAENELPFLGEWYGKKVMLLEFPHSHIPPGSDNLVKWLLERNILPMIAHPERNKGIIDDLNKIIPFMQMGCLLQLTAMSITGEFGETPMEVSKTILEKGWATVIATDAHNENFRPPILSRALEVAESIIGVEAAKQLVWDNPAKIIGVQA